MDTGNWDDKVDYLLDSRRIFFNEDYLEFYFTRVLGIHGSVAIVDFGCGLGYLGIHLLRILGNASEYSGVDLSEKLLAKGRHLLGDYGHRASFVRGDAATYKPRRKYDLAVCQTLLLHCVEPKAVLRNMADSVRDGGYVVCIEPNWNSNMAATHISEMRSTDFTDLGILQKLFENDYASTGRDGNIGIKVALYMEEIGLTDIKCRKSDKVSFVSPKMDPTTKEEVLRAYRAEGFGRIVEDEGTFTQNLIERGLSQAEAARELSLEKALNGHFNSSKEDMYFTFSANMILSSGRVARQGDA